MNDIDETTTSADNDEFDPRAAAQLLRETTVNARRQFEPFPPWLLVVRAFMALAAYGAIWLSVRGQHPYAHPTAAVIPVGVAIGIVNTVATLAVAKHATVGLGGRSRLRPGEIAVMVVAWIGVFAAMGVLAGAGVSDAIVYGRYPASAPLIVVGLAWGLMMAARAEWRLAASGFASAVVGVVAAFSGPATSWAVAGVGLFLILLERAAESAWRQRAR
jgi:hypothetical protein